MITTVILEDIYTYLQTLCNGKASVWKKRSLASKDRSDTYFKCVIIDMNETIYLYLIFLMYPNFLDSELFLPLQQMPI